MGYIQNMQLGRHRAAVAPVQDWTLSDSAQLVCHLVRAVAGQMQVAQQRPTSLDTHWTTQAVLGSPLMPNQLPAAAPAAAVLVQSSGRPLQWPMPSSTPKYRAATPVMNRVWRPIVSRASFISAFCCQAFTTSGGRAIALGGKNTFCRVCLVLVFHCQMDPTRPAPATRQVSLNAVSIRCWSSDKAPGCRSCC